MAKNIITVMKKQSETGFFVETLTNKFNGQTQIQINDTYIPKGSDGLAYARRGVNIDVIDLPAVLSAAAKLYEAETGKKLEI